MKQYIAGIAILLLSIIAAVYIAMPDKTAATKPAVTAGTVEDRAVAAYKSKNYAAALPLLREWAAKPDVRADMAKLRPVMEMILLSEAALNPVVADSQPTTATAGGDDFAIRLREIMNRPTEPDPPMGDDRIPHAPPKPGEVRTLSIKELGNFNFDPLKDSTVPKDVMALDNTRVRLRGYMIPRTQSEEITYFALVPSLIACCFGQPPGVQHIIECKTPEGKAVPYAIDELIVEGTLKIAIKREDDYTHTVFEMVVDSVKIAPQK